MRRVAESLATDGTTAAVRRRTPLTRNSAQRLNDNARAALLTHFLALSGEDRRLRFGTPLAPESIAAYVARIDFDHDAVFGIHDDALC